MKFKVKKRYKFTKAGPGRPRGGTPPKATIPRISVEDLRNEIAIKIGIKRLDCDAGKPFRKWELIQLHTFIALTIDIVTGTMSVIEI
jgi:hypothetical protein